MTPEEFRTRAVTVLDGVAPDALSYTWLKDNVTRRRSRRRALLTATTAASVAAVAVVAVVAVVAMPRGTSRGPAVDVTPAATPTDTPRPGGGVGGDVDGDGRRDEADVFEMGDRGDPDWQWGVEVDNGTHTLIEVLRPPGAEANEHQEVVGLVDVNGDGRAEVVVRAGSTATSASYLIATYIGSHLRWLSDENGEPMFLEVGGDPAVRAFGWGCSGGEVYRTETTVAAHRRTDTRTVYTVEADRLYDAGAHTRSTPASAPLSREYRPAIRCGTLDG